MAAVEDEKALQERVNDLSMQGELVDLTALLKQHPELIVDGYVDRYGAVQRTLYWACCEGHTQCAQLLIEHKADVNFKDNRGQTALHDLAIDGLLGPMELLVQNRADVNIQDDDGQTPLTICLFHGHLPIAQYLLEQKADVHYRISHEGPGSVDYNAARWFKDAQHCAMLKDATNCTPGIAFAFLSLNTDAKNTESDYYTTIMRDVRNEEYKHAQAYIDEYHRILNLVLSEHVQVDPRFGLGQMGIYQEPLERTLEYLGLSMSKDQVVNISIDGEGVRRALIPGHLLSANHWFDKYKIFCLSELLMTRPPK
jgi:hypothetical protein